MTVAYLPDKCDAHRAPLQKKSLAGRMNDNLHAPILALLID